MRKILICLTFLITVMITVHAQDLLIVNGHVTDTDSGDPIEGQMVHVIVNDSLIYITMTTDVAGYYGDSLFLQGVILSSLYLYTYDCNEEIHDTLITSFNTSVNVDFVICRPEYPPPCMAMFVYFPDSANHLTYYFIDQSTGSEPAIPPSAWSWDFGDSTFSVQHNPVHTFPGTGSYRVCLTIYDSIGYCEDTYCTEIIITAPPDECQAAFLYEFNPLQPATVQFTDLSSGDINSWLWDFGDGNVSTDQNPTHQYNQSGPFEVCLTVYSGDSGVIWCMDDTCQMITVPGYFNLGGFVFAGDFPLNNPVSEGDTAFAMLYYKTGDRLVPVDSLFFFQYGYYWFAHIIEGEYLVKVGLTETSTHFAGYLPTYYPSALTWQNASAVTLNGNDLFDANIHLIPVSTPETGPGMISGQVYYEGIVQPPAWDNTSTVEILLMNAQSEPLIFVYSGNQGTFSFSGLPYGIYKVMAELTGMYTQPVTVELSPSNPLTNNVSLELYENNVFGIDDELPAENFIVRCYPNPVCNDLFMEFNLTVSDDFLIKIFNMSGQTVLVRQIAMGQGTQIISVPFGDFSPGIYSLSVFSDQTNSSWNGKILKYF